MLGFINTKQILDRAESGPLEEQFSYKSEFQCIL